MTVFDTFGFDKEEELFWYKKLGATVVCKRRIESVGFDEWPVAAKVLIAGLIGELAR